MPHCKLKLYRNGTEPIYCRTNPFPALNQGQWERFYVTIDGERHQAFHRVPHARRKGGTSEAAKVTYVYKQGITYVLSCIAEPNEEFFTEPQLGNAANF